MGAKLPRAGSDQLIVRSKEVYGVPKLVLGLMLLVLAGTAAADAGETVPEPGALWTGPMHSPTPATLKGATVLDTKRLEALIADGKAVLIDVAPPDQKPPNMAPDKPWLPSHRSIPGSVWLPGAAPAPLDAPLEDLLAARIAALTNGDKSRPIVTFCHPDCWGSWNVGKRLVLDGYTAVHWYPDGIEGWQAAHDTAVIPEDPEWKAQKPAERKKS